MEYVNLLSVEHEELCNQIRQREKLITCFFIQFALQKLFFPQLSWAD